MKFSDGKGFGGKGRLTDGKIDILQNYYGLAVRSNLDDVDKMATAIKATLFHVPSTESNPQHDLSPDGHDSWCGYKRESLINTTMAYLSALLMRLCQFLKT